MPTRIFCHFARDSGYRAVRSLFPITDGYKPEGKDGRTEGGPPSLTRAHVGREEEIMFIVLLVYQSPLSLSFPVLILAGGGGGVGFVNLNSPLSPSKGGNIQRMSFEFPDYSYPS